jgi:hypothetical protein
MLTLVGFLLGLTATAVFHVPFWLVLLGCMLGYAVSQRPTVAPPRADQTRPPRDADYSA